MIGRIFSALKDKLNGKPFKMRSPKWSAVRKHHLLTHNYCAACGNQENLEVHHIKPFHLHPELELEESNLITLCECKDGRECHLRIGHLGDWHKFNVNVIEDSKESLWVQNRKAKFTGHAIV